MQKPTLITHTLYIQEHVMKAQEIVMTAQGIASSNIATSKVEVTLSTYSSYMGHINRVSANAVRKIKEISCGSYMWGMHLVASYISFTLGA